MVECEKLKVDLIFFFLCGLEKKSRSMHDRSELNRIGIMRPQAQTYSFQSSTVTYGGTNGPYYTASTTRRMGGDGVSILYRKVRFSLDSGGC